MDFFLPDLTFKFVEFPTYFFVHSIVKAVINNTSEIP